MITTKLLLVVALIFAGIAQQECKKRDKGKKLKKICLENIDGIFVGEFSLGTYPQTFKVTFDTERTDFWIVGPDCTTDYCKARKAFNSSQSSTFSDNNKFISFFYRDTSGLRGSTGSDVMTLSNLSIKKQDFIVVQDTFAFSPLPYDSLLGIAYYNDPNDPDRFLTPFENLGKQNSSLNTKIFSFRLSPQDGVLILGGVEPKYYTGEITYVPLETIGYWGFNVNSVSIGVVSDPLFLRSGQTKMTIDSAINFIGVPKDDYESIVSHFGADEDNHVDCDFINSSAKTSHSLNIKIGEETFSAPPDLLISYDETTNVCSLNISPVDQDYYVLGNPFLQAFYTVFDAEQHRFGIATKSETFTPRCFRKNV